MVVSRVRALALGLVLAGCASSESKREGAEIGEDCASNDDCATGLCIFVSGNSGLCTGPCADGCPAGWSCFAVRDIAEPGTVTEVCVPESPALCTRCERDSDCALTGQDLCLTDDLGKQFCGRDCSVVDCPEGFSCEEVVRGTSSSMQCKPISEACDCGDAEANSTEECTISTFAGDCLGARTCEGGIGWSECAPLSEADVPDALFADDNCDGIDGDLDNSILVAKDGDDVGTCGLTTDAPCKTINFAIGLAAAAGRGHVLVQQGLYIESIRLADGVSVWGGYNAAWTRGPHSDSNHRVEILGGADDLSGEYVAIIAQDIEATTTIADLIVTGPSASGQVGSSGRSSMGIYVRNSTALTLERIEINAGDGADGSTGTNGSNAPSLGRTSVMNGKNGGPSNEFVTSCNNSSRGAGGAPKGDNTCGAGRDPDGGTGGRGGTMDSSCSFGVCAGSGCNARPGDPGSNADTTIGTAGLGGSGGSGGGSCSNPFDGTKGFVANGARGEGATAGGFLSGNFWRTRGGTAGGIGDHGSGGGGGGGSGGCDIGTDSYGAGGGSGGAGGCRALGGGSAGSGGGASFGILVLDSELTISGCGILRGDGANGGNGGIGGRGQSGGLGGNGGTSTNDSAPGGDGGDGAHGGHGGGGGGGAGGHSIGIGSHSSTVVQDCSFAGGAAGQGGDGGLSAPTAPIAERDGRIGTDGQNGSVFGILTIP